MSLTTLNISCKATVTGVPSARRGPFPAAHKLVDPPTRTVIFLPDFLKGKKEDARFKGKDVGRREGRRRRGGRGRPRAGRSDCLIEWSLRGKKFKCPGRGCQP